MEIQHQHAQEKSSKQQVESLETELINCFKKFKIKQKFIQDALQLGLNEKFQEIAEQFVPNKQKAAFLAQMMAFSKPNKQSENPSQKTIQDIKKILRQFQVDQEYYKKIINHKILEVIEECIAKAQVSDFIEKLRSVIQIPESDLNPDQAGRQQEQLLRITIKKLQQLQYINMSAKTQILLQLLDGEDIKKLVKKLRISNANQQYVLNIERNWEQMMLTSFERIELLELYKIEMLEQGKQDLVDISDLLKQDKLEAYSKESKDQIKRKLSKQNCPSKKEILEDILTIQAQNTQNSKIQNQNNSKIQDLNQCLTIWDKIENVQHKKGKKPLQKLLQENLKKLNDLKISQQQLKPQYARLSEQLRQNIIQTSFELYLSQKLKTLTIKYLMNFYDFNSYEIKRRYLRVFQKSNGNYTFFEKMHDPQTFSAAISTKMQGIELQNSILTISQQGIENLLSLEKNLKDLFEMQNLTVNLFEGTTYQIIIAQQNFDVVLAKQIEIQTIKELILPIFLNKKFDLETDDIQIFAVFPEKKCALKSSISQAEKTQKDIRKLEVTVIAQVTIHQEQINTKYICSYFDTIGSLKTKISNQKGIAVSELKLLLRPDQQISDSESEKGDQKEREQACNQLKDEQKLCQIKPNQIYFDFNLKIGSGLLHYGFRYPDELKLEEFNAFFIETNQDEQSRFQSFRLDQNNEHSFLHQVLPYLYYAIKKRFNCEDVIANIKRIIYAKTKIQIWETDEGTNETFNKHFIHTFLLSNSQPKLRITLMNFLKSNYPIPMYFRKCQDIHSISQNYILNKELIWILHPSLTICSMGFHSEKGQIQNSNQTGKSTLLNKIFFTSFADTKQKHQLSKGIPEIFFNAYSKFYDINIIDIPRQTSYEQIKDILQNSNILILQSWQKSDFAQQKTEQLQKNFPHLFIITLLRDNKQNIKAITEKTQKLKTQNGTLINVPNLSKIEENHNFYNILRRKINQVILIQYQNKSNYDYSISNLCKNQMHSQLERKIQILKEKMFDLKKIYPKIEQLRILEKNSSNTQAQERQIQKIKSQISHGGLQKSIHQIFDYIAKNPQNDELLLSRLRQKLKLFKNCAEKPFNQIYEFKKQIEIIDENQNKAEFDDIIKCYERKINQIERVKVQLVGKTKNEIIAVLSDVGNQIQGTIKPEIFSIELAWRELIYLAQKNPQYKIGGKNLEDFLVDIKKKDIQSCQPFQLIDGDTLQMPKKLMKDVFDKKDKKVVVISVLGPQSSGKSTLFNFLFGCDFATSQGRCTRGVYGTYFQLTKRKFFNCDGIFLIDTQGLFSILNKKDQKVRRDFDSKLVLFCLGVSDIAIINTKGNIDNQTEKKLRVAMQKFENLKQQNILPPQFFLVLNQNNSSSTQTSNADINKLCDIFSQKHSYQLPQAYDINQIDSDQIHILNKNQRIIKRNSKPDFMKQCMKMLEALIVTIRKKQDDYKSLPTVIDEMQRLWATIQEFPDLASGDSKKIRELQQRIKSWKIDIFESLFDKRVHDMFEGYKKKLYTLNRIKEDFERQQQNIIKIYNEQFPSNSDKNEQERAKLASQQRNLQLSLDTKLKQLEMKIKSYQTLISVKNSKQQGSNDQYQAIKEVRNKQKQLNRQLQDEQKRQYFEKYFKKTYERTKKTIDPDFAIKQGFNDIKQFYKYAMKSKSSDKTVGLHSNQFSLDIESTYQQYKNQLTKSFSKNLPNASQYLQFTTKQPTKVLSGGKSDATFKYFKMVEYFKKSKQYKALFITQKDLSLALKSKYLQPVVRKYFYDINADEMYDYLYKIKQSINQIFRNYGFEIIDNFSKVFENKQNNNKNIKIYIKIKQNRPIQSVNFNEDNYFINTQSLQEFINQYKQVSRNKQKKGKKNKNHNNQNHQESFEFKIQGKLTKSNQIIRWDRIIEDVQSQHFYQEYYQMANKYTYQVIQQDLKDLQLNFDCLNILKFFQEKQSHGRNIQHKSTQDYPILFYRNSQPIKFQNKSEFQNMIKKLKFFWYQKISQSIKQKDIKDIRQIQQKDYVCIGLVHQQVFEVKQGMKFLENYLDIDTGKVIKTLKNENVRNFVFDELRQNGKIELLFNEINNLVKLCGPDLNRKQIESLFMQVNRQISIFANDVQQASYKPTLRFIGYCHLFAIYLYWKHYSLNAKKKSLEPLQQLQKNKPKLYQNFLKMTSKVQQKINQVQVQKIFEEILQFTKVLIIQTKKKAIQAQAKQYKDKVTRAKIQQKIELDTFRRQGQKQAMRLFLTKPEQCIQNAYQVQIRNSLKNIEASFKNPDQSEKLYEDLRNAIQILYSKVREVNMSRDTGSINSFLIIERKQEQALQQELKNQCSIIMFNYFADLIANKPASSYEYAKLKTRVIPQKFQYNRIPENICQKLMIYLKQKGLKIGNLFLFLQEANKKMIELKQNIFKTKQLNKEDQKQFRALVSVKIQQTQKEQSKQYKTIGQSPFQIRRSLLLERLKKKRQNIGQLKRNTYEQLMRNFLINSKK